MLAVFNCSVLKCPDALKNLADSESGTETEMESVSEGYSAMNDEFLAHFTSLMPEALTVNFGTIGFLAFSDDHEDPDLPRKQFASAGGIFCMFQGRMNNVPYLRRLYKLNRFTDECSIIVEAYRSMRESKTPSSPDSIMRMFEGRFAFILYDHTTKSTFVAEDPDGSVPLYWGIDAEDNAVLSIDIELVKKACGIQLGPFPKECLFKSSEGLRNFEFARKQEMIPVPWEDALGQSSGVAFVVAED